MEILTSLEAAESDSVKRIFIDFVKEYLTPSYGSMSKRDFEILLFMKLQELGAIQKDPDLYQLIKDLKISRTRVRNLLYEAKMRTSKEEDLDNELIQLLQKPVFLKDGDKVAIEIQNPLLTDYFRFKVKELGFITDGSFSVELVKLNYSAYIALVESMISVEAKKTTVKLLVDADIMRDTSFKGVFTELVKKIGSKIANEVGEQAIDEAFKYLSPIISGKIGDAKDILLELFKKD